jgi:tetratricopeptide (TPR) repeat protein
MTDLLSAGLSKVERLLVIARTSAERLRAAERSPSEMAREISIAYLIEGSVLLVEDSVRITAQLINTATEEHVWAEDYSGHLSSILSMQSQAATDIVEEIEITLTPDDERRLADVQKVNPEAYQRHLQARTHWRSGDWEAAAESIRQSIALDPDYAPAQALNAMIHVMLAGFLGRSESDEIARASVERALETDPAHPLAHVANGMIHLDLDWNWREAEKAYLRAMEFNPNYPGAHEAYGHLLYCLGRVEDAEREGLLAKAADPLSASVNDFLADLSFMKGRYDETIAHSRSALELEPNDPHAIFLTGMAYRKLGDETRAAEAFNRSLEFDSQWTLMAYQLLGRWDEIPPAVIGSVAESNPFPLSFVYAERGENDRAIELIRATMSRAPAWLVYLRPQFQSYTTLWSDPRFQEIVREVGLEGT